MRKLTEQDRGNLWLGTGVVGVMVASWLSIIVRGDGLGWTSTLGLVTTAVGALGVAAVCQGVCLTTC